jgi:predicted membrane metal-binding protein
MLMRTVAKPSRRWVALLLGDAIVQSLAVVTALNVVLYVIDAPSTMSVFCAAIGGCVWYVYRCWRRRGCELRGKPG